MYIVGTSGHIDHGKTSLIRALTGIDCDRLPEEKAREMTIDIGFASIDYPRFGTVSVIDVPGHERFIRNMVAGAWGVDVALLVIALDDGWMLQTEDHFRVLQLLGIERIIVVINKIDLGDDEMIEMVRDEVRERLDGTRYAGADIIPVSSKTGTGIGELKELIVANLRLLSKSPDAGKPYLFVDRVFSPRGIGAVITGTLKNGIFNENETVTVLPHRREVKIRKIESHYRELHEGVPSQRTALNLSNITRDELKRGDIICRNSFFTETDDIIARVSLLPDFRKIKNNTNVEVLAGTGSVNSKLIMFTETENRETPLFVRMRFEEKAFLYPGENFIITMPGGYRIVGGGTVVVPDYNPSIHKKQVREIIGGIEPDTPEQVLLFNIAVKGHLKREEIFSSLPGSRRIVDRMVMRFQEEGLIVADGDILFWPDYLEKSKTAIKDALRSLLGPNLREISDKSKVDPEICAILMKTVRNEETLIEKEGRYFTADSVTEDTLPEKKKALLERVLKNEGEGIELDKIKDDMMKRDLGDLIKLNFLVSLDGNIVYHRDVYEEMKAKVLALFDTRDKVTVPEAKDAVNLSRKFIIPLLNRIENEGLIKRLGDFRIKG